MKIFSFKLVCLVAFLIIGTISNQVSLPIKQELLIKINISLKRLEKTLEKFDTLFQNPIQMYKRAELTKRYLQ
jgi:hypothetical protein